MLRQRNPEVAWQPRARYRPCHLAAYA